MLFSLSVLLAITLQLTQVLADANCTFKHATFDESRSFTANNFKYKELHYTDFSVTRASSNTTFFNAASSPNLLALQNNRTANISVIPQATNPANDSFFFPDHFRVGCARFDEKTGVAEPVTCQLIMATPIIGYGGPETVNILLEKNQYNGTHLRKAMWGGPGTPYINVTLYDAPKGTVAYFDSIQFSVDCFPCGGNSGLLC